MPNILEKRGVFWWFGEEHAHTASVETAVPGAITISEEGRIQLQLDGPLWFEEPYVILGLDDPRWLPEGKRIIGRLGEYGDLHVIVGGLYRTDFSFARDSPIRQSYEAEFCFTNDLPFSGEFNECKLRELRIDLAGLEEWLQLDSIEVGTELWDGNRRQLKVTYKNHVLPYETPTAKISVESSVSGLPFFLISDRPQRDLNLHQENCLCYAPSSPSSFATLQAVFLRIEELIALLLGRYFRLGWPIVICHEGEDERWYKLYWLRGPRSEKLQWPGLLWTTFSEMQDSFGSLLTRWQANAEKYAASYELYIASLRNPLPYPEHDFVNLVWAVESLHRNWQREAAEADSIMRQKDVIQAVLGKFVDPAEKKLRDWLKGKLRYAYEPNLEERIVEVFGRLPVSLDPRQLRSFARRCAERRNDISHEGGPRAGEDIVTFRAEIRELAEALRYLFHGLLLHEIGTPPEVLLKAMTSSAIAERDILPAFRSVHINLPIGSPDH